MIISAYPCSLGKSEPNSAFTISPATHTSAHPSVHDIPLPASICGRARTHTYTWLRVATYVVRLLSRVHRSYGCAHMRPRVITDRYRGPVAIAYTHARICGCVPRVRVSISTTVSTTISTSVARVHFDTILLAYIPRSRM